MNRNKNLKDTGKSNKSNRSNGKQRYSRSKNNKRDNDRYNGDDAKLDATGRDNDPNWYFTDPMLAEQVSQLSFQSIEGLPVVDGFWTTKAWNHTTIAVRYLNPSPGVQGSEIGYLSNNLSAINQAGFKLFSMLSAYTGRSAIYGPQDLSTMILAMGEVISMVEWIRRAFGCMFLWSERNRNFPIKILSSMGITTSDLVTNYSDRRTRFNSIVQRINQIPIPRSVAYFDKCAALYEKIYMDSDSPMATILYDSPATTWILDETSYPGGTMLKTQYWCYATTNGIPLNQGMNTYLDILESAVNALLNSSTLNVVYTDLLNLATKMKVEFWKFDYLSEAYSVQPEYNENYLLQLHNCTVIGVLPTQFTYRGGVAVDNPFNVTPYNDVLPDPDNNILRYNPMFSRPLRATSFVDSIKPVPDVVDRIEMLRFTSAGGTWVSVGEGQSYAAQGYSDFALPDHYVVKMRAFWPEATSAADLDHSTPFCTYALSSGEFQNAIDFSNVDWMPITFRMDLNEDHYLEMVNDYHRMLGDTNYYTWVPAQYINKVIEFVGISLYSIR